MKDSGSFMDNGVSGVSFDEGLGVLDTGVSEGMRRLFVIIEGILNGLNGKTSQ